MYKDLINILMFYYLAIATIIVLVILIIFIEKFILRKFKKNEYYNILMKIATLIGILSAHIFFSYENIIRLPKNAIDYYSKLIYKSYISFLITVIIYYLIKWVKKSYKNIFITAQIANNDNTINSVRTSSKSSLNLFVFLLVLFIIIYYILSIII